MKDRADQDYDVKLMALKRWNSPQKKSLFEDGAESVKYGDYVSFTSYHFIDIIDIPVESNFTSELCTEYGLSGIYNALSQLRENYQDKVVQDTHIVQTMPLLGQRNTFWEHEVDVLYITFIQLSDFAAVAYDDLNLAISSYLNEQKQVEGKTTPQFALYQSIDFCDYVLFTKDIQLEQLQDLLWGLALKRDICQENVRDTFTIYSMGWNYLHQSFCHPELVQWDDFLVATINLSIQSLYTFSLLRERFADAKIKIFERKMCGRFDISLSTNLLPCKDIVKVFQILDGFNHSTTVANNINLCGYEVILTTNRIDDNCSGSSPSRDTDLRDAGTFYLDTWNNVYGSKVYENKNLEIHKIANYIIETICSLKELLANGFADEFILCVLPSFATVLDISLFYSQECENLSSLNSNEFEKVELVRRKRKSLHNLWRNYFAALNTLSLCTMHSERQFIQAPAFNASYFETPPKLLAYYCAIVNDIVEKLNSSTNDTYSFVIAPDFRDDINVTDLPIADQYENSKHLAIININEAFIYSPSKAVLLFAHEVAHFVGDRNRKFRSQLIFKATSLKILQQTTLFNLIDSYDGQEDFITILCDAMGDFLFEIYDETDRREKISYHSKSIDRFLKNSEYGLSFLRDPFLRDKLAGKVLNHIYEAVPKSSRLIDSFKRGICSIEETLQTDFYSNILQTDPYCMTPYLLFANKVPLIIKELDDRRETEQGKKDFETVFRYLDEIVCSFFEAYADYKMFELCGVCNTDKFSFACAAYEELLQDLTGCNTLQYFLRHESVLGVLPIGNAYNPCLLESELLETHVQQRIVRYIAEYIKSCVPIENISTLSQKAIFVFADGNLQEQYNHINQVIKEYRGKAIEICQNKSLDLVNQMSRICYSL